mmetsp:Transcript_2562/g.6516  ORF Transcript_2562/g.6516 Transcript_2562/m.6516 type:complete len:336 (+) Transcript_2562:1125-2132(+)
MLAPSWLFTPQPYAIPMRLRPIWVGTEPHKAPPTFAAPKAMSSFMATIWYPAIIANFFAPANDDRKVTSPTSTAPGSNSCAIARSSLFCSGQAILGSPEGTSPTLSMSASMKLHTAAVTMSSDNSLKSPRNLRPRCSFTSFFALNRKAMQIKLNATVAPLNSFNSCGCPATIWRMPPTSDFGNPIMGLICESMMRMAEAVINPLKAGLDRNRTRKERRNAPIKDITRPTKSVKIAPARVRSSSSSLNFMSCSPVSRLTSPPVPTDEWMQVPKSEYSSGGNIQPYGPQMSATLHKSACANDCATRMHPKVIAPAISWPVLTLQGYVGSHSRMGTYL